MDRLNPIIVAKVCMINKHIPMRQYPHSVVTKPSKCEAATLSCKAIAVIARLPIWYGQNANTNINNAFIDTTQNTCSKNTNEPSNPKSRSQVKSSAARSPQSIGFQCPSST